MHNSISSPSPLNSVAGNPQSPTLDEELRKVADSSIDGGAEYPLPEDEMSDEELRKVADLSIDGGAEYSRLDNEILGVPGPSTLEQASQNETTPMAESSAMSFSFIDPPPINSGEPDQFIFSPADPPVSLGKRKRTTLKAQASGRIRGGRNIKTKKVREDHEEAAAQELPRKRRKSKGDEDPSWTPRSGR